MMKVGDVVRLKSGGPNMTVDKCWTDEASGEEKVKCSWMDSSGNRRWTQFHPDAVELVPKDASDNI